MGAGSKIRPPGVSVTSGAPLCVACDSVFWLRSADGTQRFHPMFMLGLAMCTRMQQYIWWQDFRCGELQLVWGRHIVGRYNYGEAHFMMRRAIHLPTWTVHAFPNALYLALSSPWGSPGGSRTRWASIGALTYSGGFRTASLFANRSEGLPEGSGADRSPSTSRCCSR